MVEIKDIKDAESLRLWLSGPQQKNAVAITHRVAMRILPIYLEKVIPHYAEETGDLTATPVLWASLISGVMAFCPTTVYVEEIKHRAQKSFIAVEAIVKLSNDAVAFAKSNPTSATFNYDLPASISLVASAASISSFIGFKSSFSFFSLDIHFNDIVNDTWNYVRADCVTLDSGDSIARMPLWTEGQNPLAEHWVNVKALMKASPKDWSFWIKWYEAALNGEPLNCKMLERIALIPSDDWEQGPKHVNGLIAAIEAEFERVEPEIEMTPAHMLSRNKSVIESQLDTLFQLVTEEKNRLRGQNDFTEVEGERITARLSVMESILAAIEKIKAALEGAEPSTALAVIEEQLPEVLSGAAELAKGEDEPQVSVSIAQMGETISFLTQKGTPGTLATGMAFVDWSISHPIKWWKHWRNSKS